MSFEAKVNNTYAVNLPAEVAQTSDSIDLRLATKSIGFQFQWDSGVVGDITFEASLYTDPPKWTPLVACEEVKFATTDYADLRTCIIAIPDVWTLCAKIRWNFTPAAGSNGNISAAIRIVPI